MSLYFLDKRGNWQDSRGRGRVPRERHWGHYQNAQGRRPDLIRRPAGRDLPGIDLPHIYDMIRACSHKLSLSLHRGGEPSWKGPSSALTP